MSFIKNNTVLLENSIKEFIEKIPSSYFFDTHAVIDFLLQKHTEAYLCNYGNINGNLTVGSYHGHIGSFISEIFASDSGPIENAGMSFSRTIREEYSECTLWRKK